MVEQLTVNQPVAGSSPARGANTIRNLLLTLLFYLVAFYQPCRKTHIIENLKEIKHIASQGFFLWQVGKVDGVLPRWSSSLSSLSCFRQKRDPRDIPLQDFPP